MRKLVLIGAIAAVAVPGAAAATVTVSITKNGYVPKAVTIAVGDSSPVHEHGHGRPPSRP